MTTKRTMPAPPPAPPPKPRPELELALEVAKLRKTLDQRLDSIDNTIADGLIDIRDAINNLELNR